MCFQINLQKRHKKKHVLKNSILQEKTHDFDSQERTAHRAQFPHEQEKSLAIKIYYI